MSEFKPFGWLRESEDAEKRKKWQKSESQIEKVVDGKKTPGSGAPWHSKGDVKSSQYLVEGKYTDKESMSVKKAWLDKIAEEAIKARKVPILVIDFKGQAFYVLREIDFKSRFMEDQGEPL